MSLTRIGKLGAIRDSQRNAVGAEMAAPAPPANGQSKVDSAIAKITAFIPSEVVGIYVALLAFIAPATPEGQWWIFWVSFALVPVFVFLGYNVQKNGKNGYGTLLVLSLFGVVAFTAWAGALPSTPFLQFGDKATQIGGAAVIVLAALLYPLAQKLGIVPVNPGS